MGDIMHDRTAPQLPENDLGDIGSNHEAEPDQVGKNNECALLEEWRSRRVEEINKLKTQMTHLDRLCRQIQTEVAAIDVLLGKMSFGSEGQFTGIDNSTYSNSVNQNTVPRELKTDQHQFYRKGNRIVRVGMRKDGVTPYQTSITRNHVNAFVKALAERGSDREFSMNGGLLETLRSELSRENAYVVKTWMVACGLIAEQDRNLYWIASESIADDVQSWWERTPVLQR